MNAQADALTAELVADYLRAHPAFFNDHLELLEKLQIPHPSGTAISLISKQLELLRNRNQEMEAQLTSLIEIAKSNDMAFDRIHKLTLALIESSTLAETIERLETVLSDYFMADFVAVRIVAGQTEPLLPQLILSPGSNELEPFLALLSADQPKYGRPTLAQAKVLFGDAALEVQSAAILPLKYADMSGILAIGSRNSDRFHYSMGSFFMTHLGEIIGARLLSMLTQNTYA